MKCTNCGKELPEHANFCNRCGTPVARTPGQFEVTPSKTGDGRYGQPGLKTDNSKTDSPWLETPKPPQPGKRKKDKEKPRKEKGTKQKPANDSGSLRFKTSSIVIIIALIMAAGLLAGLAIGWFVIGSPFHRDSRENEPTYTESREQASEEEANTDEALLESDTEVKPETAATAEPKTEAPETEPQDIEITWHDTVLEARIREILDIADEEPVMASDAEAVTTLDLANQEGDWAKIESIEDIRNFPNLTVLDISYNDVEDISPVSELSKLMTFGIIDNRVSDLSPLAGMGSLRNLNVAGNNISDISPLEGLNLEVIGLNRNQISDISPLMSMENLKIANLSDNRISDISPLAGLMRLESVYLNNNPVQDFSPVENVPNVYR